MNDFINFTLSKLSRSGKAVVRPSAFILVISCLMVIVPTVADAVNLYLERGEVGLDYAIYLAPGVFLVCCMIASFPMLLKMIAEMKNDNITTKEECVMTTRPITLEKVVVWLSFFGSTLLYLGLIALVVFDAVASYREHGEIDFFFLVPLGFMTHLMTGGILVFIKSAREVENKSAMAKKDSEIAAQSVREQREIENEESVMANKDDGMPPQQVKRVFLLSIYTMIDVLVLSLLCHIVMFDFYVIDKQISGGSIAYREAFADFLFFDVSSDKGQMLADISGAWKVFIILSFFAPWLYFWGKKFKASAVKGIYRINLFCGVIGSIFLIYFYFDLISFDINRLGIFMAAFVLFVVNLFMRMMEMMYGKKSGVNPDTRSLFGSFGGYCMGHLSILVLATIEHLFHLF